MLSISHLLSNWHFNANISDSPSPEKPPPAMETEIPMPVLFALYLWLFGFGFLFMGIEALDRSTLSKSVSPPIMSLFKHFLSFSFCYSTTYAFVLRPDIKIPLQKYFPWISFAVFPLSFYGVATTESFQWYFPVYSIINLSALLFYFLPTMREFMCEGLSYKLSIGIAFLPLLCYYPPLLRGASGWHTSMFASNLFIHLSIVIKFPVHGIFILMHVGSVAWVFFFCGESRNFPFPVILTAFFAASISAAISGDERFKTWIPEATIAVVRNHPSFLWLQRRIKENGKVIEFVIGMAGAILFQNFFRPAAFEDVVVFLYLAVAWLGHRAMVLANWDLGVFNFFLSNVIVGCTVSQFGLRGSTWLAYAICVALFLLKRKVEALIVIIDDQDP